MRRAKVEEANLSNERCALRPSRRLNCANSHSSRLSPLDSSSKSFREFNRKWPRQAGNPNQRAFSLELAPSGRVAHSLMAQQPRHYPLRLPLLQPPLASSTTRPPRLTHPTIVLQNHSSPVPLTRPTSPINPLPLHISTRQHMRPLLLISLLPPASRTAYQKVL